MLTASLFLPAFLWCRHPAGTFREEVQDWSRSGLEARGTLEVNVATSDILKVDNSAIPLRPPVGAVLALPIASKTSEVARARRLGIGAE